MDVGSISLHQLSERFAVNICIIRYSFIYFGRMNTLPLSQINYAVTAYAYKTPAVISQAASTKIIAKK